MAIKLETYQGFNPYIIEDAFAFCGWETELVKASNADLVETEEGSAVECGDGRFGFLVPRKKYGPAVFGGINGVAALKTGGDWVGFINAAKELWRVGYAPGTHGAEHHGEGCGLFGLWKNGELESAVHSCSLVHTLELLENLGQKGSERIMAIMEFFGGKHFRLPGEHKENKLVWNPFIGMTEKVLNGDAFRNDDWLFELLGGIPLEKRIEFNIETVEKLKPDCKKVEILVP